VITVETTDLTRKKPVVETGRIAIDGKRMSMHDGAAGEAPGMIFRGDRELIWAIQPEKKQYVELTKETLDRVGGQLDAAMQEMEKRLAEMPPQQRAMVERMMRERMPGKADSRGAVLGEPVVKRTDETKQIAGFPCTKYEIHRDDRIVREIWVTPWSNIDPGREAFGIFDELEEFFGGLLENLQSSPLAAQLQNPFEQVSKIDGFPVMTREFQDGRATRESVFESVQLQELPETAFEPPEGYKKTDAGEQLREKRRR
jgi:hypothetical protein